MKLFSLFAPCLLLSGLSSAVSHTTCSYPSKDTIKSVFSHIVSGDYPAFFTHVVDTVDWDIQGTHPLAGRYLNKTLFAVNALARLSKIQDNTAPHETTLINVVGGCDEEWSMQEMVATAVFQNGTFENIHMISHIFFSFTPPKTDQKKAFIGPTTTRG